MMILNWRLCHLAFMRGLDRILFEVAANFSQSGGEAATADESSREQRI
jgi:hypothetical protein